MMTWFLRAMAVLLMLGAVLAGVLGYRMSTAPQPSAGVGQAPSVTQAMLVHTTQALSAGTVLEQDMLELRAVPEPAPAGSLRALPPLRGRALARDLPAGQLLTLDMLVLPTNQLQKDLRQGERAVAIKVDELVGLGGFAQPGDLVDVLLFLRASNETGDASSAQVVLSGARVLAYGDALTPPEPEEATATPADGSLPPRQGSKASSRSTDGKGKAVTSAVLAVPESESARLMLASNSGVLRLALHPPLILGGEAGTELSGADPHFVELGQMVPKPLRTRQTAMSDPASGARPQHAQPAVSLFPAVVIHEGEKTRAADEARP